MNRSLVKLLGVVKAVTKLVRGCSRMKSEIWDSVYALVKLNMKHFVKNLVQYENKEPFSFLES